MVCIYCRGSTAVHNSRPQKQLNQVWRRRTCSACGGTFTTHEKVDLSTAIVVRNNQGRLAPFSHDCLFISIYEACKHRTTAINDAGTLTSTVVASLQPLLTDGRIDHAAITQTTHEILDRFDKAAATMYAAYHSPTTS